MPTSLEKLRRDFRDINYLGAAKRAFDDKPLQCSFYVTDQCNLDCQYCTEYDNSQKHPALEDVKKWLTHIRELGTLRIALVGGEPLMHPDIVAITRFAKDLKFSVSLTTNGLLLKPDLVAALEQAGLEVMQISVDRVNPSAITKKSLKGLKKKIDLICNSSIKTHITGVICEDTLDDCEEILDYGLSRGVPTEVRLVHADPTQNFRVDPGERARQRKILELMIEKKKAGMKIHTSNAMLDYQLSLVDGDDRANDWVCAGGYKLFFVSAKGRFMECSMRPTTRHILDMTNDDLKAYHRRKSCQTGCGVYCVISTSMFIEKPLSFVSGEIGPRLAQNFGGAASKKVPASAGA